MGENPDLNTHVQRITNFKNVQSENRMRRVGQDVSYFFPQKKKKTKMLFVQNILQSIGNMI